MDYCRGLNIEECYCLMYFLIELCCLVFERYLKVMLAISSAYRLLLRLKGLLICP